MYYVVVPGGGAILGQNPKDLHWTSVWTYAGVTAMGAGAIFTILRFVKVGWKFNVKV